MIIKNISLENFRCFENLNISFNPEYTIIIGINGSGKSSILEAAAIALGGYLVGFDGIATKNLSSTDAHREMYKRGSRVETESIYPVKIECNAEIPEIRKIAGIGEISWERILKSERGRTLTSSDIMKTILGVHQTLRLGDDIILPIVAYYGTNRLYKTTKKEKNEKNIVRVKGYSECISSSANDAQMMQWFKLMTLIELQEGKKIPELEAVKRAMEKCYSGIDSKKEAKFHYSIKSDELEIEHIDHQGKVELLPVKMLSDGLRITLSMVANIAYRMAVLNPQLLDDVIEKTPGVVLIDEIDMHLHPQWQRKIVENLHAIFPKVQFIMTTHAPAILSNVRSEHIQILDNGKISSPKSETYGRSIDDMLSGIMKTKAKPDRVIELTNKFYESIEKENIEDASKILKEMAKILGEDDSELVRARAVYDLEVME